MLQKERFPRNLFDKPSYNKAKEIFETLLENQSFKLEKITSFGQATVSGKWLVQDKDEWVILLSGKACIKFDNQEEFELKAGDYLDIPAFLRHRVEWTDAQQETVWLALHYLRGSGNTKPGAPIGIREVKVIRSKRRKRTAGARLSKDVMYIHVPHNISDGSLQKLIESFKNKFEKKVIKRELNKDGDLKKIAQDLNKRYFGGKLNIKSIEYSAYQNSKFGCCNYHKNSIRISHQVAEMPAWVRNYVLIHELAHLVVPNHSRAFWDLVNKYELTERAKGYLIAKGYELTESQE